jgi:hypothetical protein
METPTKFSRVKVSVDLDMALAFKKACAAPNVSMAAVLTQFIAGYSKGLTMVKVKPDYSTRHRRRVAIMRFVKQMEGVHHKLWSEYKNVKIGVKMECFFIVTINKYQ